MNKANLRNDFTNNVLTDIKLSKAQLSKIIQSGVFLGNMMSNLGNKSANKPCCFFS